MVTLLQDTNFTDPELLQLMESPIIVMFSKCFATTFDDKRVMFVTSITLLLPAASTSVEIEATPSASLVKKTLSKILEDDE